ncbi:hypothetical protein TanjilG_07822 [Lupinus angustifolius]|uniref:C2 domain-containing protein n=1 Tax=Lupinus angustifolius TaxID=3871 RepID=A0A1J7I5V6_LUPAN|nr:PREDICTED: protein SRC2 homolog [Lupinus angustifolius]OIW09437.1 hypothetical protein TanjilG_07822 [Lupinus angustifolius]
MEPTIDIKLISCENIQTFNFFQKLTLYALLSIDTTNPEKTKLSDKQKQQQRTQTHRDPEDEYGNNPIWNHESRFNIGWVPRSSLVKGSRNDLFLRFEFRHDGLILGDKFVGECCVPLLDLVIDAECDVARFVSYEVRNSDGKSNGICNFSYKVKGISNVSGSGTHLSESEFLEGRISGYPVVNSSELRVQYPKVEIEKPFCYPSIECYSPSAAAPLPVISSPSYGEYNYYYPPPPPLQSPYPYPAPPPLVTQYYPHFGPEAHAWPSDFQRRW